MNFIKEKLKSNVLKNGMWMYALQFFNMIIPMLTIPYVTRVLGNSGYGQFSSAFNIVSYLQVIVEYGFIMSASREVSLNKKKVNHIFSCIFFSRLALFVFCLLFLTCFFQLYRLSNEEILNYLLLSISLLGTVLQADWLFQGLQDMKYISLTNIFARTLTTILIFVLVNNKKDVFLYCLFYSLSPFISNTIGIIVASYKYRIRLMKVSLSDLWVELKEGWYIFTTQFTSKVFGAVGITFLTFFTTSKTVGTFSAIQKIPSVVQMLWIPISQVMYPLVSQRLNSSFQDGLSFVLSLRKKILLVFAVVVLITIIFSKYIVLIAFGNAYVEYYYWLIPLMLWAFVSIDNGLLGVQILLAGGYDKEYSYCFMISVIVTIVSSYLLVYLFGGIGASFAPLISETFLDVLLLKEVKKLRNR